MINYLFSSINITKGFTEKQKEYIIKDISDDGIITFITSYFENYNKNDELVSLYIKLFKSIEINFKNVNLIDGRISMEEAKNALKKSNIVFLLGGIPELQMNLIKKYELIDYIKNCKVIMGVSAGAMNQAKNIMYKDDFDNFKIKTYDGIGIIDINIFPHVDLQDSQLFMEAKQISNYLPLFALPNESFIRIKNNKVEIIGEFYYLYNKN